MEEEEENHFPIFNSSHLEAEKVEKNLPLKSHALCYVMSIC